MTYYLFRKLPEGLALEEVIVLNCIEQARGYTIAKYGKAKDLFLVRACFFRGVMYPFDREDELWIRED